LPRRRRRLFRSRSLGMGVDLLMCFVFYCCRILLSS
jgi:hypothetical protein